MNYYVAGGVSGGDSPLPAHPLADVRAAGGPLPGSPGAVWPGVPGLAAADHRCHIDCLPYRVVRCKSVAKMRGRTVFLCTFAENSTHKF